MQNYHKTDNDVHYGNKDRYEHDTMTIKDSGNKNFTKNMKHGAKR